MNMQTLMQQAQKMQKEMAKAQEALNEKEIIGSRIGIQRRAGTAYVLRDNKADPGDPAMGL